MEYIIAISDILVTDYFYLDSALIYWTQHESLSSDKNVRGFLTGSLEETDVCFCLIADE